MKISIKISIQTLKHREEAEEKEFVGFREKSITFSLGIGIMLSTLYTRRLKIKI